MRVVIGVTIAAVAGALLVQGWRGLRERARQEAFLDACGCGDVETIRTLLAQGVDINGGGRYGTTGLLRAARITNIEAARILLEHGADPNVGTPGGLTPLHYATSEPELVRMLLSRGAKVDVGSDGVTPLHRAAASGEPDSVRLLVEHGAPVNRVDAWGETPLDLALQHLGAEVQEFRRRDYTAVVEILRAHGGRQATSGK